MRRLVVALILLAGLAWPAGALAEPIHLESPSTVTTDGGSTLRLTAGYFIPEDAWQRLDLEVHRLQDVETRLVAENDALRVSPAPVGTWLFAGAFGLVVGIVLGAWAL